MTRYSRLPVEAIADQRLGIRHFRVLAALWTFAKPDGTGCHPTRGHLSEMTGISEKKITVITADLRDFGWIEKSGNGGRSTALDYTLRTSPKLGGGYAGDNLPQIGEKTSPVFWVGYEEKTSPKSGTKPPPNLVLNLPQIGEKTSPKSGEGHTTAHQQPINSPSTAQLRDPVPDASGSVCETPQISAAKKSRLTPEMSLACRRTWDAYSVAYHDRYGVAPVKNGKVAGQVVAFVKRIGQEEAPHIAAYYPTHSGRWYVQTAHSVDAMLRDAEKLRMEWATNRRITSESARQADATQSNFNAAEQAKALIARRAAP